uniref:Putative secreted protein n=1 Tax=Ixodes ricinus TaxID=34613 RepID=A0A6B0V0Y7_IXORI
MQARWLAPVALVLRSKLYASDAKLNTRLRCISRRERERERETKQRGASHAPLETEHRILIKTNQCRHRPGEGNALTRFASTAQGSAMMGIATAAPLYSILKRSLGVSVLWEHLVTLGRPKSSCLCLPWHSSSAFEREKLASDVWLSRSDLFGGRGGDRGSFCLRCTRRTLKNACVGRLTLAFERVRPVQWRQRQLA